jgi:chromosomal replication initiation ATPase DnaA
VTNKSAQDRLAALEKTLSDALAQIRQLQRAVAMLLEVEPSPLSSRRRTLNAILADMQKIGGES